MSFSQWLLTSYGISNLNEGRMGRRLFLPQIVSEQEPKPIQLHKGLENLGVRIGQFENQNGLLLSEDSFHNAIRVINIHWQKANPELFKPEVFALPETKKKFADFVNNYFDHIGVDVNKKKYTSENIPFNFHLFFQDEESKKSFLRNFASFAPKPSRDILTGRESVEITPVLFEQLKNNYRQANQAKTTVRSADQLRQKIHRIKIILQEMAGNNLKTSMEYFRFLLLDNKNTQLSRGHAIASYAFYLEIYAIAFQDNLTAEEYTKIILTARLLAGYDEKVKVGNSLIYQNKLINKLQTDFCKVNDQENLLHTSQAGREVLKQLEEKINDILLGRKYDVGTPGLPRFLPDSFMQSEIDEIIFTSGGSTDHFAITRIIKVGVRADSQYTHNKNEIHHYDYFRVEHNSGARTYNVNFAEGTCTGTYVTKLIPMVFENGERKACHIDPFQDPGTYQTVMSQTIAALLMCEHQLEFYASPVSSNPEVASTSTTSIHMQESQRLRNIFMQLCGQPFTGVVPYVARDILNLDSQEIFTTQNNRDFCQTRGSCPAYSTKSLVRSLLGNALATEHMDFIFKTDTDQIVQLLQETKTKTEQELYSVVSESTSLPVLGNNAVSFFQPGNSDLVSSSTGVSFNPAAATQFCPPH